MMPDSSSITHMFIEGAEVYPCRCGEFHSGPYAAEARRHHECLHDERLAKLSSTQALCPYCGKSFILEPLEQEDMTELETLRAKLAEVRKRVVHDFYTGSSPDSLHCWYCGLCDWKWQDGEAEKHAPGCPLEEKP